MKTNTVIRAEKCIMWVGWIMFFWMNSIFWEIFWIQTLKHCARVHLGPSHQLIMNNALIFVDPFHDLTSVGGKQRDRFTINKNTLMVISMIYMLT